MKNFFAILFLVFWMGYVVAQKLENKVILNPLIVENVLHPSTSVSIDGYIGERLDAAYQNRILAQDIDRLIAPFKDRTETRCWQSEFWGKWFTSAVLAYRYRPEPKLKKMLDKAVDGLIATQTTEGYIGNYADDTRLTNWDIWGRKYCMLGLLAYYDLTKEQKALDAAGKVADHLMQELKDYGVLIVKMGNHRGMAATSVLEPVCLLYARTGENRYLHFAEEIVRQWEIADGPQLISKADIDVSSRFPKPSNWWGWDQGQKAYEMMSCYEGLPELYRLTGKEEYLTAVEKTRDNILANEINIAGSGSAVECWFGGKQFQAMPIYHYQETCVTATWIKLNQQLLRLTGETKYADAIEQAYYNALLGAMSPDGSDWAKYTPLSGQRMKGSEQCGMGLNCCVASGPRALFTFPHTTVMSSEEGLQVNFFAEGTYKIQTPCGQQAEIIQQTDYPVNGKVIIKLLLPKPENMSVRVRIPGWSKKTTLIVNGEPVRELIPGRYADIQREWKTGDLIGLELDMRGRVIRLGEMPGNIAVVRGPIVLARDARLPGPVVDDVITPLPNNEGFLDLELIDHNRQNIWMQFKTLVRTESYTERGNQVSVEFCDYSSAGNTIDESSRFRVWFPQLLDPGKLDN